jgi:hypothetical protein
MRAGNCLEAFTGEPSIRTSILAIERAHGEAGGWSGGTNALEGIGR